MISLRKGSNRNTNCHIGTFGDYVFYFSYKTCIGYDGPNGQVRRDNDWGPTTGRHFKEMGIKEWNVVSEKEMDDLVNSAFVPA